MRQHTIVGERILAAAPALRAGRAARAPSHERWDGAGYPDGLAGEEIPLGARIIAVCDAFDAMTRTRAYASALQPRARRSPSCAAAPARSSTPRSSTRSAPATRWRPSAWRSPLA